MAKINMKLHVKLILVTLLTSFFLISLNNSSYGVKMIDAKRDSNMKVVDNNEAYVGIENKESYVVDPGSTFTITIKNNLPYVVNYNIDMLEPYISKVEPNQFVLDASGGCKQVTVYVSENAEAGIHDTKGVVHAKWDSGDSDVNINFKTYINLKKIQPPR